jgi:hypothetical protein
LVNAAMDISTPLLPHSILRMRRPSVVSDLRHVATSRRPPQIAELIGRRHPIPEWNFVPCCRFERRYECTQGVAWSPNHKSEISAIPSRSGKWTDSPPWAMTPPIEIQETSARPAGSSGLNSTLIFGAFERDWIVRCCCGPGRVPRHVSCGRKLTLASSARPLSPRLLGHGGASTARAIVWLTP